jgi:hypothetical protein
MAYPVPTESYQPFVRPETLTVKPRKNRGKKVKKGFKPVNPPGNRGLKVFYGLNGDPGGEKKTVLKKTGVKKNVLKKTG